MTSLTFIHTSRGEDTYFAQRTRGTTFRQPWEDTMGVKRMLTWQYTYLLSSFILICILYQRPRRKLLGVLYHITDRYIKYIA